MTSLLPSPSPKPGIVIPSAEKMFTFTELNRNPESQAIKVLEPHWLKHILKHAKQGLTECNLHIPLHITGPNMKIIHIDHEHMIACAIIYFRQRNYDADVVPGTSMIKVSWNPIKKNAEYHKMIAQWSHDNNSNNNNNNQIGKKQKQVCSRRNLNEEKNMSSTRFCHQKHRKQQQRQLSPQEKQMLFIRKMQNFKSNHKNIHL